MSKKVGNQLSSYTIICLAFAVDLRCLAKGLFPLRRCVALRLKAFKRVATQRNATP